MDNRLQQLANGLESLSTAVYGAAWKDDLQAPAIPPVARAIDRFGRRVWGFSWRHFLDSDFPTTGARAFLCTMYHRAVHHV